MPIENSDGRKSSGEKYTCATCNTIVRGTNGRTFCVLNQSAPEGQIPSDISVERLEANMQVYPIMLRRIMNGMSYPHEENACSYHSELSRAEEMRGIELTLLDWQRRPIDDWGLTVRVTNILKSESVTLQEIIELGQSAFRKRIPRMGLKSVLEIKQFLSGIRVNWKE